MKLNPNILELEKIRKRMGAPLSEWQLPNMKVGRGITITIDVLNDVTNKDGFLVYKEQKIVIYIKDTRLERETLENDMKASKRYHFSECDTIKQMRKIGRFERYVYTTRSDGNFSVIATDLERKEDEEIIVKLLACKNCLKQGIGLKYGNDEDWSKITPKIIYEKFTPIFKPRPRFPHSSYPSGNYNKNWSEISKRKRESVNFKCEYCHINLIDHKNLLQVHHKNGVRNDDRQKNLVALCKECHRRQHHHGWIKISKEELQVINSKRKKNVSYLTK